MQLFAFYGRASDKRRQDIDASYTWQRERARALITPTGGRIVAEYFDANVKRSVPWPQRPEAHRLLETLKDPQRGFDAVVIGEPHRAFAGTQFALTYPLFAQHGVPLWVPELDGPIDPTNEAHDIIMTLYAGMSAAERIRIRTRVRAAMQSLTRTEGRFLGGRPPYGYQLIDAGPHPNPSKATTGQRIHCLDLDTTTAPTVRHIFTEYLNGTSITAITEQLNQEEITGPDKTAKSWSRRGVIAILSNPRYTGYAVWNKSRRHEVLTDPDDVAQGHRTVRRANLGTDWIWSAKPAHPAIIDVATFNAAQDHLAAARSPMPIVCGHCNHTLNLTQDGDTPAYHCTTTARKNTTHPTRLMVPKRRVLAGINDWIARSLTESAAPATRFSAHPPAIQRELADCEDRLQRHRAALEAGIDPHLIVEWTRDLVQQRSALLASLKTDAPTSDIEAVLTTPHRLTAILNAAPISQLQRLYAALNLRVVYHDTNTLTITVTNTATV
jgi:DNA invertase Pin-like site-specific DNA recombinase